MSYVTAAMVDCRVTRRGSRLGIPVGADVAHGVRVSVAVNGAGDAALICRRAAGVGPGVGGEATGEKGVGLGEVAVVGEGAEESVGAGDVTRSD